MTSIVSTTALPPVSQLQNELASEVSSGAIGSSDQSTLSSALTTLDNQLTGELSSSSASLTPGALESKFNSLIDKAVSNGNLTRNQGTKLKRVFVQTLVNGSGALEGSSGQDPADESNSAADGSGSSSRSGSAVTVDELAKQLQGSGVSITQTKITPQVKQQLEQLIKTGDVVNITS